MNCVQICMYAHNREKLCVQARIMEHVSFLRRICLELDLVQVATNTNIYTQLISVPDKAISHAAGTLVS